MTTEFNLSEKRKEFIDKINYALDKFNWGNSPLDAKAIDILNTWQKILIEQDKEFIRLLKEELFSDARAGNACEVWKKYVYEKIDKLAGEKLA